MRVGATRKGRASHLQKTARQFNLATIPALFSFSEEAIETKQIGNAASSTVTATIGIGPRSEGGFGITAALDVFLPDVPEAEAKALVGATHEICPYSNAIKASVDVKITIRS